MSTAEGSAPRRSDEDTDTVRIRRRRRAGPASRTTELRDEHRAGEGNSSAPGGNETFSAEQIGSSHAI